MSGDALFEFVFKGKRVCFHLCVCVCLWERERERERKVRGNRSGCSSVGGAIMEMGIRFTLLQFARAHNYSPSLSLTHSHTHTHTNGTYIRRDCTVISSPLRGNVFITNLVTCISLLHTHTHKPAKRQANKVNYCVSFSLSCSTLHYEVIKTHNFLCLFSPCTHLCVCAHLFVCCVWEHAFYMSHLVSVFLHWVLLGLFASVSDASAILRKHMTDVCVCVCVCVCASGLVKRPEGYWLI